MRIKLDQILITLEQTEKGVILSSGEVDELFFINQVVDETSEILKSNYATVKDHYNERARGIIDPLELDILCLKIVLHYFNMYNTWRVIYPQHKNQDLKFLDKDFEHPVTHDKIIFFLREKYPEDHKVKCQALLGMTNEEFSLYEKRRDEYLNR